ncbi:hypothetical protein L208DRAFT_1409327, partial [Tricholoma matsutake]
MANWIDVFSFAATVTVLCGVVYSVLFIVQQINDSIQNTKASLKTRGLDISSKGVSIKTQKRFDREQYVDATQRGFVRAVGAATFGKADNASPPLPPSSRMSRQISSSSTKSNGSNDETKKRGFFSRTNSSKEK